MHSNSPSHGPSRGERGENDPRNLSFRKIFAELTPALQAEYLLERYTAKDGIIGLFTESDLQDERVISPKLIDKIKKIIFVKSEDTGHFREFEDFSPQSEDMLALEVMAAGVIGDNLYLAIALLNAEGEMILPNFSQSEASARYSAKSESSFCGFVVKLPKNLSEDRFQTDFRTALSPDLVDSEIKKFIEGDFSGFLGQQINSGLKFKKINSQIHSLVFVAELNQEKNPLGVSIGQHFGMLLEDGSVVTACYACDSQMIWGISNLIHFPNAAESFVNNITDKKLSRDDALSNHALLWNATEIPITELLLDFGKISEHAAVNMLRLPDYACLPQEINSVDPGELFSLPVAGVKVNDEPVSNYMRLFIKYYDRDNLVVVPTENGAVSFGDLPCSVFVDLLAVEENGKNRLKYIIPKGINISDQALGSELNRIVSGSRYSVFKPLLLRFLKEFDQRFKSELIQEKGIRIASVQNTHGKPYIIFFIEHQFGASLIALNRLGDTNLISFDSDSWKYLGSIDRYSDKEIPAQVW